jgi:hypothetical protein
MAEACRTGGPDSRDLTSAEFSHTTRSRIRSDVRDQPLQLVGIPQREQRWP